MKKYSFLTYLISDENHIAMEEGPEFRFSDKEFFDILGCCIDLWKDQDPIFDIGLVTSVMIELFVIESDRRFWEVFADTCEKIVAGEVSAYSALRVNSTKFKSYYEREVGQIQISDEAKAAAKHFLEFLASQPEHWPPRKVTPQG